MIAKFIDKETIQEFNGSYVKHDGMIYTNPTKEQLKNAGFVNVKGEPPEIDPQTEQLSVVYKNGNPIKAVYTVEKIEGESVD